MSEFQCDVVQNSEKRTDGLWVDFSNLKFKIYIRQRMRIIQYLRRLLWCKFFDTRQYIILCCLLVCVMVQKDFTEFFIFVYKLDMYFLNNWNLKGKRLA